MIVILIVIIFICVYRLKTNILLFCRAYNSSRKLLPLPGCLPVIGHGWKFFKHRNDLFPIFDEMSRYLVDNSISVAVMWIGPLPFVVIVDPDDALKMCNECMEKSYIYHFSSSWLGQGLVTANYMNWKKHRKLILPTFNSAVLNDFLPVFNETAYIFLNHLKSVEGFFDPMPLLARYNMEVLCQTVLGLSPNSVLMEGFEENVDKILNILMRRFATVPYHFNFIYDFTKDAAVEQDIIRRLKKVSLDIIDHKNKNNLNVSESTERHKFKAFLDLLLALRDQGSMSEQEVREELDTMIVAGYDTSYSAMAFILPVLGKHQDVQQRVYDEMELIFGDSKREVNKDDLNKMQYLDAVILEVLRVHPITPLIGRKITKEVQLRWVFIVKLAYRDLSILSKIIRYYTGDHTIEEGCDVIIFASGINRHKCWGEDRHKFNPDRWFDNNVSRNAYASFGIGRRDCIGKTYSFISMKTLLVHLIRRYKLTKEEGDIRTDFQILSKPKFGHRIKLENR